VASAEEALKDSGLLEDKFDPYRVGVIIGTGIGGLRDIEEQQKVLMEKGPRRVSPFFIPYGISNMASGLIAIRFGLKGPNYCVVSACATGNHSIGDAFRLIQREI
jgi:3-oxoacyl-[acyl-carrier-protein] synthase II